VTQNGATVTYSQVTHVGCTVISTSTSNPGGSLPTGLCSLLLFVEISTTAMYTAPIDVAIQYSAPTSGNETSLRLLHWNGSHWVDVTTSVDPVNHICYGQVNSHSPFCIGYACGGGGGGAGGLLCGL
jgi:hypothetical protein